MWCSQDFSGECGGTLIETSSLIGLIGVLCIVAVIGFGDHVGEFYCDLIDNNSDTTGSDRAGLSFTADSGEAYRWDSGTHRCILVQSAWTPFGGGNGT